MEQAIALGFDDNSAHTPVVWCVTGYPEANPAQCLRSRVVGKLLSSMYRIDAQLVSASGAFTVSESCQPQLWA
jgi:hypothetical protein